MSPSVVQMGELRHTVYGELWDGKRIVTPCWCCLLADI